MRITRRNALAGTAAVAAVAVAGKPARPANEPDTDLLAQADRYWSLRDEGLALDRSAPDSPKAWWNRIYDRVAELDEEAFGIAGRISDTPARTGKGLAAKLRIIRFVAGFRDGVKVLKDGNRYDAAVALGLWTAIEDATRLAGEARS